MAHTVEPSVVEAFMSLFRSWLGRKPYEPSTVAGAVSNIRIAITHLGVAPAGDRVDQYILTLSSHLRSRFRWAWEHYVTFCRETRTTKIPGLPSPPRRGRPPNMGNGSDPSTMPPAAATLAILILLQRFKRDLLLRLTWGDYFPEGVSALVADDGPVFWYIPNRNQRHVRAVIPLTATDVETLATLRAWACPPSPYAPLLPQRPGSTVPMSLSYLSEVVTHFRNHRMEPQATEAHVEPKPKSGRGRQESPTPPKQRRMGPSLADMAPVLPAGLGSPGVDDLPPEVRDLLEGPEVRRQKEHRAALLRTPGGVETLLHEMSQGEDGGHHVQPEDVVLPKLPKEDPAPPKQPPAPERQLTLRERRLRALQRRQRRLAAEVALVEEIEPHGEVVEEIVEDEVQDVIPEDP